MDRFSETLLLPISVLLVFIIVIAAVYNTSQCHSSVRPIGNHGTICDSGATLLIENNIAYCHCSEK